MSKFSLHKRRETARRLACPVSRVPKSRVKTICSLNKQNLHMIVDTNGVASIGDVLRDFKKFTSKGIVKAIQENEQESRQE